MLIVLAAFQLWNMCLGQYERSGVFRSVEAVLRIGEIILCEIVIYLGELCTCTPFEAVYRLFFQRDSQFELSETF